MRAEEIQHLLPGVFQRTLVPGSPLAALLGVMEALQAPSEEAIAGFHAVLDPRRTRDGFVPMLAAWLDLQRLFERRSRNTEPSLRQLWPPGLGRLRELTAIAAELSQWRGTRRGLLLFLETATGLKGFDADDGPPGPDGLPQPFHVRVRVPPGGRSHRSLIARIVESEKPAYVTYELDFGPESPGR
jgi:phage tail-like protein